MTKLICILLYVIIFVKFVLSKNETNKLKDKQLMLFKNKHYYSTNYSFENREESKSQKNNKIFLKNKKSTSIISTYKMTSTNAYQMNSSSKEINLNNEFSFNDFEIQEQNKLELVRERIKEKYQNKTKMIIEELEENSWDYMTELIFILVLALLSIPANLFLFLFYKRKEKLYKQSKKLIHDSNCARIENSFNTYIIEICWFDSIIVSYLVINTSFQVLYHFKKVQYESVFDISNFTCKFFIYILRISGAMSNYLVFLLAFNRCFLIYFNKSHKSVKLAESPRICLNTKYLTLFLFCICTIANVFRLELLNLNNTSSTNTVNLLTGHAANKDLLINLDNNSNSYSPTVNQHANLPQSLIELILMTNGTIPRTTAECGPNINMIAFSENNESDALFWSIIVYNISFSIVPALGNLFSSIYLIRKRSQLKKKLDIISDLISKSLQHAKNLKEATDIDAENEEIDSQNLIEQINVNANNCQIDFSIKQCNESRSSSLNMAKNYTNLNLYQRYYAADLYLNEFQIEFLKTCTPCIFFSLTHVILFLPYSIFELINQIRPYLSIIQLLQYMTYLRYMFYCCKFYLLYIASYKFRKEFKSFFRISSVKSK